jgi:hypothetical protein
MKIWNGKDDVDILSSCILKKRSSTVIVVVGGPNIYFLWK